MKKQTLNQQKLTRRDVLRWAGVGGSAALLAACAPPAPAAPAVPAATSAASAASTTAPTLATDAPAASGDEVNISWWNQYQTDSVKQATAQIIKDFEAGNAGVKVKFEVSGGPPGGGNFMEVLLARIAAGNPPDTATIFTSPAEFGSLGSLLPLDEMMAQAQYAKPGAFYENVLKSCQWRGKTYGLPASAGAGGLFINKPAFEKKGISTKREDFPKTWDEWKRLSAEMTIWEGDELKQAGWVPNTAENWLYPVYSGLNGGKIFDAAAEKYVIDSPQNIEWLDYWVKWIDEQYKGDIEKLNTFGNFGGVYDPNSTFNSHLSTMNVNGSWICTDVDFDFEWEVGKLPVGPSGSESVTGYYPNWFVLPKASPHPEQGFKLIEYFATKGWETWYSLIMDTPAWKEFPRTVITKKLIDKFGQARAENVHGFFADYLNSAVPMWDSPVQGFATDTFSAGINDVLAKKKTPKEGLEEVQKVVQAKLEETLKSAS